MPSVTCVQQIELMRSDSKIIKVPKFVIKTL